MKMNGRSRAIVRYCPTLSGLFMKEAVNCFGGGETGEGSAFDARFFEGVTGEGEGRQVSGDEGALGMEGSRQGVMPKVGFDTLDGAVGGEIRPYFIPKHLFNFIGGIIKAQGTFCWIDVHGDEVVMR